MPSHFFYLESFLFLLTLYLQFVTATPTNYTIDDTFGDLRTGQQVIYQPSNAWADQTCNGCAILPNVSQMMNGTYHAATWNPGEPDENITINFSGTAIYVFFTLINNPGAFPIWVTTMTTVNFMLDQAPPRYFQYTPKGVIENLFQYTSTGVTEYLFRYPVFTQDHLAQGNHTLVITGDPGPGNRPYYVNFDYAIYTYDRDWQSVFSSTSEGVQISASDIQTTVPHFATSPTDQFSHTYNTLSEPTTSAITTPTGMSSLFASASSDSEGVSASANTGALSHSTRSTGVKAGLISGLLIGGLTFLGGLVVLTRHIWRQRKFRKHQERTKEAVRFYSEKLVRRVYPIN